MERNICTKEDKFFKTIFKKWREEDLEFDFKEEFGRGIRKNEWEETLSRYLHDIVCAVCDSERLNVKVSFENVDDRRDWREDCDDEEDYIYYTRKGLMGLHSLDSGALFFAFHCGGDWEEPVNAILYVEDNVPKVYIPEKGNVFNTRYMSAYGNHNDNDEYEEKMCDQAKELKDIADYFENRKEFEHANGKIW